MNVKNCLIKMDHFFTETMNSWMEKRKYGQEVDFSIPGGGIGIEKDYVRYQASVIISNKLLRTLPITENDSILDIGCGKGKMVNYFDELGFGKSDGLEFSEELVQCARNNMRLLDKNNHIIHGDATGFDRYNNYNYFYFYNPFGEETMRLVIQKIEESCRKNPRRVTIIYFNPLCHEQIIESSYFHLQCSDNNFYRRITKRITNIYVNED